MTKEQMLALVEKQLEAYNRRNTDAFCACYHDEIQVHREIGMPPTTKGMKQFRENYREQFEKTPNLKAQIKSRMILPSSIVDEEFVTGLAAYPDGLHVAAVYQFRDGLIHRVWFAR